MGALKLLFSTYWQPILALTLCLSIVGYVGYQRHRINALERDNASLQATIDLTKAIGQAANEKADRIEQGAHAATIAGMAQYQTDLERLKNEKPNPTKRVPNSMCQSATNPRSSQVSSLPESTQGVTASGQDADTAITGTSLEQSCAITTLQYNALHDSWDKACLAFGCN